MFPGMQVADFQTVVFRQKQLGFNAVRLPMTFSDLNLAPKIWTKPCIDDMADLKVCMDAFVSGLHRGLCEVPVSDTSTGRQLGEHLLCRYTFLVTQLH